MTTFSTALIIFFQAIENVNSSNHHKVVDVFVLIILHSANRKKAVESLFRNKIRNGHFTEVLLKAAFCTHSEVTRAVPPKHTLFKVSYFILAKFKNYTLFTLFFSQIL